MMLRFMSGDLFESKAETLVNTVNCVGIMGKGVALAFKQRYPEMYEKYRLQCDRDEIQLGILTLYTDTKPWIINFPTKHHWRSHSRLKSIEAGLEYLVQHYREWGITSLAMPALGCGHGGLDWRDVRPLIERYLGQLDDVEIEVYEPGSGASLPGEIPSEASASLAYQTDLFGELVEPARPKRKSQRRKKVAGSN
jgi:O-acetyl-ADP-ribose deacetylase (regulator of RNase III)